MLQSFAKTHIGQRQVNEDNYLIDKKFNLYIVADGVGGLDKGEVASSLACQEVLNSIKSGATLKDSVEYAHQKIINEIKHNKKSEGMATTIVAVLFNQNAYEIAWVGDSRVYIWDKGLKLITRDDSYVELLLENGHISLDELETHPDRNVISQALGIQRKEGEIFQYWDEYISKSKKCGYKLLSWNIWNRENAGFSVANITSMFATQHEWIFVFGRKVKTLNKTIKNKEAGNTRSEIANRQKDGSIKKAKAPVINTHRQLGTINTINPQLARDEFTTKHPATFPVELPSEYIKAMTNEKEFVSEPFTGSGTTMVAAHQLNRKCYGMELDPKYCQVIIDRMQKLDPTLSVKINGKEYVKTTVEQ